ncbi:hypothetical protein PLANPX_5326 [Lacipirellula parvula]|uniref:Uncharacterized protein n=1 Tax=Lacipirellula parvula TaxID=2650471 RepID=A0A5K7XFT1_9BACT|nr:hypothetical protein PLANPX_5326 [Lacipirellula parvula]
MDSVLVEFKPHRHRNHGICDHSRREKQKDLHPPETMVMPFHD